jgi:alpha-pyrone synthase
MTAYISAIGTATPKHKVSQADAVRFMTGAMALTPLEKRKLQAVYRLSGIKQRYSVLEDYARTYGYYRFFPNSENLEPFPSTRERMAVYNAEAPGLALSAAKACLKQLAGLPAAAITHLITISCTGLQAPGLDIALVQSLGLSASVSRTCVNFMGCYAAINGLKLANSICLASPESKVLVVSVELCTLHFQNKADEDNLMANALFGDGAAAVLVESQQREGMQLALDQFYCDLALEGLEDMAWNIGDTGFEMRLSSYIPAFIKGGLEQLLKGLLRNMPDVGKESALFAIHPGGRRILEATEQALGLQRSANRFSYAVLEEYGNMSSATVLFVLKALWEEAGRQLNNTPIISFAFGPGLTMESMLLRVKAA